MITLSWTAPTSNADGTPLIDLAGFKMYRVMPDGSKVQVADIPKDQLTTDIDLPPGDYDFVGTAYDTSGNESKFTNIVHKDTLPPDTYILTIQ